MAEHPIRIQRRRTKGWKMPANTVYVGRPSKWGNPWTIARARASGLFRPDLLYKVCAEEYRAAISVFPVRQWRIKAWREYGGNTAMLIALASKIGPVLDELRGKNLCCWCPLDQPCHADILLEIANA